MVHTADNGVLLPQSHVIDKRPRAARGFTLGDRVVYIRSSGAVPFGSRGTVMSMCGEMVEVKLLAVLRPIISHTYTHTHTHTHSLTLL